MIQINTIFLNEHLQKNIKDSIKAIGIKNDIDYELALLKGDENGVYTQIRNPKRTLKVLSWKDLKALYRLEIEKDKEGIYRGVYTFYIKDDFNIVKNLEESLMNIGLYETIERPLPNTYHCTTCHWEGKYYELTSIDLGFSDIEDNVCPSCESDQIQPLKIKNKIS